VSPCIILLIENTVVFWLYISYVIT